MSDIVLTDKSYVDIEFMEGLCDRVYNMQAGNFIYSQNIKGG